MSILAAELIDGENISPRWAGDLHRVLRREVHQGVELVARLVVGAPLALQAWKEAIAAYHLQPCSHAGGKNAADKLLQEKAFSFANRGIYRFYIASNDGDFASTTKRLCSRGCQVVGFGNAQAARRFVAACTGFAILGSSQKQLAEMFARLDQTLRLGQGKGEDTLSQHAAFQMTTHSLQEMLRTLYGSHNIPSSWNDLLTLLLQHTFTALCLSQQESELSAQWLPSEDAEMLATGLQDPFLSVLLAQNAELRVRWQTVQGFASRCSHAYHQGRATAVQAVPHFPQQCLHALHQEHLSHLLTTWRYHPYGGTCEIQQIAPGFSPESEHVILLR